jgi:hypothetical protein
MKTGKATSVYLPDRLAPIVTKRGAGLAAGITSALGRYADLLGPTIARMEKEFSGEIRILGKIAPLEEWRARGVRSAVLTLVQDAPEEYFPMGKEELIERLEVLTVLESYALAEAIEKGAL